MISLSDFIVNHDATPLGLESRARGGRNLSRSSLPRGGYREEEGGRCEKSAPGMKGSKNGKSEKGAYMSQNGVTQK